MNDWNNPFQQPLLNAKAQTFAASADIPGSSPNVEIDLRADKTKKRDPKKLCGSKHAVWIGIQPPPPANRPNQITPFENNIVVAFWANDTSGGGIIDPGAVIGGIGTLITDPTHYENVVEEGYDIIKQQYKDGEVSGFEYRAYQVVYYGAMPARWVANIGNSASTVWNKSKLSPKNWWAESNERFATDYWGLDYHNAAANAHKVSIEISCKYKGETRIVHDTELAGTNQIYAGDKPKPALAYFVIDSPGEWKVRVRSLASGNCADPNLDVVERFNVPEPPTTDKSAESKIAVVPTATAAFAVALIGLTTAWVWRSTR
jgi:hypothetical protein